MSVTALHELLSGHAQIMPLTVEQYEHLIAAGILPEGAPYERDGTTKLRVYAKSGIAQYVIINLPDRVVEVYTNPLASQGRYGESTTLRPGRSVEFPAARGKKLSVLVKSLVP